MSLEFEGVPTSEELEQFNGSHVLIQNVRQKYAICGVIERATVEGESLLIQFLWAFWSEVIDDEDGLSGVPKHWQESDSLQYTALKISSASDGLEQNGQLILRAHGKGELLRFFPIGYRTVTSEAFASGKCDGHW